ncbi:MAG: hypothetical protein CMI59_01055 [Parvibaculum sp.]|jgi:hypothetical protein|nr:hypothetical protein [Parvibaculum sp.]
MRNPVGGTKRKVKSDSADGRMRRGRPLQDTKTKEDGSETGGEGADYLLETLTGARQLAAAQGYRFLAYLLGLALEEARQLSQTGESWSTSWRDRSSGTDRRGE